ncbi:hypothetical protein BUALT_Bualt13G0107000 [Buddleja alternifolia]|uniref:MLO-like protein n=1 Tax=Buddleja alternifolia TaxID=168488 RepID=A0AAV6WXF0_9LAMI|nr:hypothetical protein BUALT_Bualt13G0107000 [Buddleja alternifolia]
MSEGGEGEETSLEFTPTWVVAGVCTVIVAFSLAAERLLHYAGKYLKKKNQKPLYEALQKVKEELMLLGFISLLLTVFQSRIVKICVPADTMEHLLPCSLSSKPSSHGEGSNATLEVGSHHRRLLAEESDAGYCAAKNKVPLLSLEGLHHLHVFIFVLAIVHVTFSVLTVVLGGAKIQQWKHWEDSIAKDNYDTRHVLKHKVTHVHQHDFIKKRFLGMGRHSAIMGWLMKSSTIESDGGDGGIAEKNEHPQAHAAAAINTALSVSSTQNRALPSPLKVHRLPPTLSHQSHHTQPNPSARHQPNSANHRP